MGILRSLSLLGPNAWWINLQSMLGDNEVYVATPVVFLELPLIEPETSKEKWIGWFEEEKQLVRLRFGYDEEAKRYFPDDYYEKMVQWWANHNENPIDPIEIYKEEGIIRIADGHHRFAISHLLGLKMIACIWRTKCT